MQYTEVGNFRVIWRVWWFIKSCFFFVFFSAFLAILSECPSFAAALLGRAGRSGREAIKLSVPPCLCESHRYYGHCLLLPKHRDPSIEAFQSRLVILRMLTDHG